MNKKYLLLLLIALALFFSFLINNFKFLSRPSTEYDEGVYLTTFLLVDSGKALYKETFFSQFPGFFYSAYPGFLLFGKTLEAGRLTVFIWSLVGLLGVLWLSYEIGNVLIGVSAIAILYNISLYIDQSLTFHADSIPTVFSIASIASMLRFKKKNNFFFIALSVLFFSISLLIKFETTAIFSLIFIFISIFKERKMTINKVFLLLTFSLVFFFSLFYLSLLPFGGITPFYNSSLLVRLKGIVGRSFPAFKFFEYIFNIKFLLLIIVTGLALSVFGLFKIKKKEDKFPFLILLIWFLSSCLFLIIYRPLFPHHLVLLAVPFSLLFAYLFIYFAQQFFGQTLLKILIFLFLIFTIFNLINYSNSHSQSYQNYLLNKGVEIINKNTSLKDYVVSDDGFLNAFSKRLPPPWLVDISDVRIKSGVLKSSDFEREIKKYKPKLIMFWSGRIKKIKGIEEVLKNNNYKLLEAVDKDHKAFIIKS